ncbi:aminoacyl-histidine dipeptidase [Clostridium sp. DL1XJH146]
MSKVLENLQPKKVFSYFEEMSNIPRGSGNEKRISDYLVDFAKEHKLEYYQDDALNVIIKKPAYKGYEKTQTVIIQGHMDMVCEKSEEMQHDFEKDPLDLQVDGDFVKANLTTLGADNGIAVAFALALLDSKDIPHPPIEVLVTTEEETGMSGAANVDGSKLNGTILINIDSEEEGELLTSCAGGVRSIVELPIDWQEVGNNQVEYKIKISGLKGGHSGIEIDKNRASAAKLLGRLLFNLNKELKFKLAHIEAGAKMNAIPRDAFAKILIDKSDIEKLQKIMNSWEITFNNEYSGVEDKINISLEEILKLDGKAFTDDVKEKAITLLVTIPQGVQSMSPHISGLVQSSTNLGVVKTTDSILSFESAVRSSVKSLKDEITNRIEAISKMVGANQKLISAYPEWQYKEDSYIRDLFASTYKDMYGVDTKITAIHAGLECGLLKERIGDIDMISFGPNMYDVHTPQERLSISSTKRTWEFLLGVLKRI